MRLGRVRSDIPATACTRLAFSPWTKYKMLRCEESVLPFSSSKTLSTPYSLSVGNWTKRLSSPVRSRPMTRFFFPRTYPISVWELRGVANRRPLTPSRRLRSSFLALFRRCSASLSREGAMAHDLLVQFYSTTHGTEGLKFGHANPSRLETTRNARLGKRG